MGRVKGEELAEDRCYRMNWVPRDVGGGADHCGVLIQVSIPGCAWRWVRTLATDGQKDIDGSGWAADTGKVSGKGYR